MIMAIFLHRTSVIAITISINNRTATPTMAPAPAPGAVAIIRSIGPFLILWGFIGSAPRATFIGSRAIPPSPRGRAPATLGGASRITRAP
ncbi:hypothetical protein MLD38_024184 [Melastoma candidum]|uniref:Uncharacterized protein n=1 Tax=Melastoma candidum TaxID=119954 RepID=A0ACB9NRM6_9MYRT|nr:hypothetical protein MLD38_024184 [Melastoma candidum]